MHNRFFLIPDKGRDVFELKIHDPASDVRNDCAYFYRSVVAADRLLGDQGLDFYLTWDLDWIPKSGPNVVVFLLGDERYQVPSYLGRVLAVFKTGGVSSFRPYSPFGSTRFLWAVDEIRTARDAGVRVRRAWKTRHAYRARKRTLFPIPIGYCSQIDVASKPLSARTHDVLFAGQLDPVSPSRTWLPNTMTLRPREWARASLARALRDFASTRPRYSCHWLGQAPYLADAFAYSQALANAKISLCPRGNFPETFRFCESARAGCAIISEPLPPTWYFRDHPALIVRHWRELPAMADKLLSTPSLLDAYHRKSQAWWSDVAGESALGNYVAECLSPLLGISESDRMSVRS
jgi:hypothetical protein